MRAPLDARRALAVFALGLGLFALACQIVAGIERVEKEDRPDASVTPPPPDAPVEAEPPPPDPCVHATVPPPPAVDDDPNTELPDFWVALRTLTLLPPTPIGFDLDGVCTCDKRPNTAYDGGESCVRSEPACDGDGGVDNQAAISAATFLSVVNVDQAANIQNRIDRGQQTVLVLVTRYNGRANDREVGVGLVTSEGIRDGGSPCDGSAPLDGFYTPGWCGQDPWTIQRASLLNDIGKPLPKAQGKAYVSNYMLVASYGGDAHIPFASYRLTLGSPISVTKLVPLGTDLKPRDPSRPPTKEEEALYRFDDGIIAGRIPASDLLGALGTVALPGSPGKHLCDSPERFALLKGILCSSLDINRSASLDHVAGAACNAISTAIQVQAFPAVAGEILDPPAETNSCYPNAAGDRPVSDASTVTYTCTP